MAIDRWNGLPRSAHRRGAPCLNMAGKNMALRPAATGWVDPLRIDPPSWGAVENAIGRELTEAERAHITEVLQFHRGFIQAVICDSVTAQTRKRTLAGAARLPLDQVLGWYRNAGDTVEAHVELELYRAGARSMDDLLCPTPAEIQAAAAAALANMATTKGGRRSMAPRHLAVATLRLWRDLGGPECRPSATRRSKLPSWFRQGTSSYASPIVHFGATLFGVAGEKRSASAVAKLLREAEGRLLDTTPKM